MLGHLTTLVPEHPKSVFVIGFGAGVTAGAVSIDPRVERVDDRGDRAAGPQDGGPVLQCPQLRRRQQSEGADPDRRRAALPVDDARDVRRDYLRPARPVGQGRGHALLARVLRPGETPPEPRRRRHAVCPAVLEQRRGGEEPDRHLLRDLPERDRLREHVQRRRLRPRPARTGRSGAPRHRRARRAPRRAASTRRSRSRCARSATRRSSTCCRRSRATRPTSRAGCRTR